MGNLSSRIGMAEDQVINLENTVEKVSVIEWQKREKNNMNRKDKKG
jgi:hypothetical protein